MAHEARTSWKQAQSFEFHHNQAGEALYLARVLPHNTSVLLEGFVTTHEEMSPQLELPVLSSMMRYSAEDLQYLEPSLQLPYNLISKDALRAVMARRNVQAFGFNPNGLTLMDIHRFLPVVPGEGFRGNCHGGEARNGLENLSVGLSGDGTKKGEQSLHGIDVEVMEQYARRVNERCSTLSLEPYVFVDWLALTDRDLLKVKELH